MRTLSALLPAPPFAADRFGEHKITNIFTVGPRLGYAWDRWMIFGTGGAAAADIKAQYCVASTGLCGLSASAQNGQSTHCGWFVGGGFEYMVHKGALVDVILGAEYQHYDVGEKTAFCFGCGMCQSGFDYNTSAVGDIVRARLTIKTQGWGWSGSGRSAPWSRKLITRANSCERPRATPGAFSLRLQRRTQG